MKRIIWLVFLLFGMLQIPTIQAFTPQNAPLKLGAERMDVITRLLKDKQVGLVVNQTSILEKSQKHLLDALLEQGIQVKKVFAPEHGFRGTGDPGGKSKIAGTRKQAYLLFLSTAKIKNRPRNSWQGWMSLFSTYKM